MIVNSAIQDEVKKRNITRLCHFVHTNKLLHILNSEEGIRAVNFIEYDILKQNDELRLDGKKDFINCSIEYPNYWYFRKVENNDAIFSDWAIVFIDPITISFATTEFCPVNAAKRYGAYIGKGYNVFKSIFDEQIERQRRTPQMLTNVPTDDQAEVLVYKNIPRKYITGIAFKNEEIAKRKKAEWKVLNIPPIDVYIAPELFERTASDKIRRGIKPYEHLYMGE